MGLPKKEIVTFLTLPQVLCLEVRDNALEFFFKVSFQALFGFLQLISDFPAALVEIQLGAQLSLQIPEVSPLLTRLLTGLCLHCCSCKMLYKHSTSLANHWLQP